MIYLDTSALVKLVFDEEESAALTQWVAVRSGEPMVSSDLATIELLRTCRRIDPNALPAASLLLGGLDLLAVDHGIVESASSVGPAGLRSLDAIHLASAVSLEGHLSALVAYDDRLCSAAGEAGLAVASPR